LSAVRRGIAGARALACAALLFACSSEGAPPADGGAPPDATVRDTGLPDGNSFMLDVPTCPSPLAPGAPCTNGNMICAGPVECEPCGNGYVMRSPTCVCEAFWTCDQCFGCGRCDAGAVYGDPACTELVPPDAGHDSGSDAGQDGASEGGNDGGADSAGDGD
jgi:hypothetical protein